MKLLSLGMLNVTAFVACYLPVLRAVHQIATSACVCFPSSVLHSLAEKMRGQT